MTKPGVGPEWVALGRHVSFPTTGDRQAHVVVYLPVNPNYAPLPGELPPLIVMIHGGPTSTAQIEYKLSVQFWTTRGFAVADVNHRGSTTYGRRYRNLLQGEWGLVDVDDCAAVVSFLASEGLIDVDRAVIRGGSSGGFTTLAALANTKVFAAGASYYGIADLAVLAEETHGFESRYFDSLIAPWPEGAEEYRRRSPLFRADQITAPVILFHGSDDAVVPPNQSELIAHALRANGVPHAHMEFVGEGHGFRQADTLRTTLQAEWSFYCQILGIDHDTDCDIDPDNDGGDVNIWRP